FLFPSHYARYPFFRSPLFRPSFIPGVGTEQASGAVLASLGPADIVPLHNSVATVHRGSSNARRKPHGRVSLVAVQTIWFPSAIPRPLKGPPPPMGPASYPAVPRRGVG